MPAEQQTTTEDIPELQIEKQNIWQKALNLPKTGKIKAKTRQELENILGKEKIDTLVTKKNKPARPEAVKNICQLLSETRTGLYPYIKVDKPEEQKVKLPTPEVLNKLVRNPYTKEAQAAAWIVNNFIEKTNEDAFKKAFERLSNDDLGNITLLKSMRAAYGEIAQDEENFDIGDETVHKGKLGDIQKRINEIATDLLKRGLKAAEKERLYTKKDELENEMRAMKKRKTVLHSKLTSLNATARKIKTQSGKPLYDFTSAELKEHSEEFKPSNIPTVWSEKVKIGDSIHAGGEWIASDDQKSVLERYVRRARVAGAGPLSASVVLDELLEAQFGTSVALAGEEDRKKFFEQLKSSLLSNGGAEGDAGPAGDSGVVGETGAAAAEQRKSLGRRSWDAVIHGQSSPYNPFTWPHRWLAKNLARGQGFGVNPLTWPVRWTYRNFYKGEGAGWNPLTWPSRISGSVKSTLTNDAKSLSKGVQGGLRWFFTSKHKWFS